ncbi:MAG TPA: AmmeMemoRadiSam system protein B [Candidatus Hypogeohydataceae bacterium YC38]
MVVRSPVATGFYPEVAGVCKAAVERHLKKASQYQAQRKAIVAGIVPHAGWMYSGDTAAAVFASIKSRPDVFLLFGSVHISGISSPAIMTEGSWETPLGEVEVDSDLARGFLKVAGGLVVENTEGHLMEHSIEVQVPFIQHLFPEAKIVPIMVPPIREACSLGKRAAEFIKGQGREVMTLGTSDLTHYGYRYGLHTMGSGKKALEWVKNINDKRIIDLCLSMAQEEIVPEATINYNACGPGALAATVSYARTLGVERGELLHYTTSYDVEPVGEPSDFVGYAAMIF